MKYDIDYFIKKFEAIPRNKWITGLYSNVKNDKHCALGHCGVTAQKLAHNTPEALELSDIFKYSPNTPHTVDINDGNNEYKTLGKHPRTRILRALKNLKKKGTVL